MTKPHHLPIYDHPQNLPYSTTLTIDDPRDLDNTLTLSVDFSLAYDEHWRRFYVDDFEIDPTFFKHQTFTNQEKEKLLNTIETEFTYRNSF